MDLRVVTADGQLVCSECGPIPEDPDEPTLRSAAFDHLLDAHRQRMVAASCEVAVARTER